MTGDRFGDPGNRRHTTVDEWLSGDFPKAAVFDGHTWSIVEVEFNMGIWTLELERVVRGKPSWHPADLPLRPGYCGLPHARIIQRDATVTMTLQLMGCAVADQFMAKEADRP